MMRCMNCGTELDADMRFCPDCGSSVPHKEDDELMQIYRALNASSDVREEPKASFVGAPDVFTKDPDAPAEEPASAPDDAALTAEETPAPDEPETPERSFTRTAPVTRMYRPAGNAAVTRLYGGAAAPDDNFDVQRSDAVHGRVDLPHGSVTPPTPAATPARPEQQPRSVPQREADRPPTPGVSYEDNYILNGTDRALTEEEPFRSDEPDDGYTDVDSGRYPRTTAGKRIGSICLCILTALLLTFTLCSGIVRIVLTPDHIREAADDGLTEKKLLTDFGSLTAAQYLRRLIGTDTAQTLGITDAMLNTALTESGTAELVGDLIADYADFLLYDRTPTHLNADTVTEGLTRLNTALSAACGYDAAIFDVSAVRESINGGDLSFLSIDEDGGYFQQRYGVSPKLFSTLGSLPVLIICGGIVLLCIVMIFLINSANPPAGLRFNGTVLLICGAVFLLTALGTAVLSLIWDIWILSVMLRYAALWLGSISLAIFVTGILFIVIAGSLRRRAAMRDGQ